MKKNILSLLLIISIISSNLQLVAAENQASTINTGILKLLKIKGVQISESYDDNLSCTNSIIENNKKFPNFFRKGCFYDTNKFKYFYLLYTKDLENIVNSKLSLQSNISSTIINTANYTNLSNNTQNNYNISPKNKATLDKIILGAKNKQSFYKTNEEYITYLDNLNMKVYKLKDKYSTIKGFSILMDYLSEGVLTIRSSNLPINIDDNIESVLNNEFLINNNSNINTGTNVSTQVINDSYNNASNTGNLLIINNKNNTNSNYNYSWVLGDWSACNNNKMERLISCKKNDGTIVANSNCSLANGEVESRKACVIPGTTKVATCSNLPENASWVNTKLTITQIWKKNEGSTNQDYVYLPYNTTIYSNDTNFCSYKCNEGFHYFKQACIKNGESYDKNEFISMENTKYSFINSYQFNSISDYNKSLESNINYCKINNLGSTMIRQQYTFKYWTTDLSEDAGYEIWCAK